MKPNFNIAFAFQQGDIDVAGEREAVLRKAISDLVRSCRKRGFMTQEQLAYRSGISYEHLNRVENYKAMPSIEVLDRIARSLGFDSISEFLRADESSIL